MSHPYASELHPHPNPNAPRVCEGCGCTDEDPCFDPEAGRPCFWFAGYEGDVCSVCARLLLGGRLDPGELEAEPLVQLYGKSDLDQAIREIRRQRT
jgi:hypothetical protein